MGMFIVKGIGSKNLKGVRMPKSMQERQDRKNKAHVKELRDKLKKTN
jgi:hypothetical protein